MKANRTCIVLIMLFCANVLFAQRKEAVSISLDEIKDMPQKILQLISNLSIRLQVCRIL